MKKPILITIFIALVFSFLSLFSMSIKPALSLYEEVYSHVAISYWYNYDTSLTVTHFSSCDKFLSEIAKFMFSLLPEPEKPNFIIISDSGIERNFISPHEKKSPESNPSKH